MAPLARYKQEYTQNTQALVTALQTTKPLECEPKARAIAIKVLEKPIVLLKTGEDLAKAQMSYELTLAKLVEASLGGAPELTQKQSDEVEDKEAAL